ncbi:MAG: zinc-binding dehydrogenase [Acidimicrobiia bacterium]|nr:zinc-binding dehydrogenase [Acidimicrobiia bacterium]
MSRTLDGTCDSQRRAGSVAGVKALEFTRNEGRYAAAALSSRIRPGSGASTGPLHLVERDPFDLPGEGWHRVTTLLSGICGSDLATVEGKSSRYFEPWVSFPFVPGHEVVGRLDDGSRVVLEPVLGHAARGFEPPFDGAAPGDGDDYRHLVAGRLEPGIQTGYCASTGGGWSTEFVAHRSQLHPVPDRLSDEAAVMIEPTAVGVHATMRAGIGDGDTVAIIGAGTMGLTTLAAIRRYTSPGMVIVGAKYPEQKALARDLGADLVIAPEELQRAVRRNGGSFVIGDDLSGGADVIVDAVGSADTIELAIGTARPRGRVLLVGMPGKVSLNLTALWHRETELVGAYTYGTETFPDGSRHKTFDLATELVEQADLGRLVTDVFRLDDYQEALEQAVMAGSRGSIKVCFDLR